MFFSQKAREEFSKDQVVILKERFNQGMNSRKRKAMITKCAADLATSRKRIEVFLIG